MSLIGFTSIIIIIFYFYRNKSKKLKKRIKHLDYSDGNYTMDNMFTDTCEDELVTEITKLRELLRTKEAKLACLRQEKQVMQEHGLNNDEICRYSRQLFLTEVGVKGM